MNMKKIEKKLSKLEEQKAKNPNAKIDKKIMKLEKKKAKLEKWLKVKLPFRILIKGLATWLIIGGVCYGCSYIPVVREIKMATMGAIAYAAPEPVTKVLDVVTLNIGASDNDFEWLKTTLQKYINEEIELKTKDSGTSGISSYHNGNTGEVSYTYFLNGEEVTEEEYNKYDTNRRDKEKEILKEVFGTTDTNKINSMSIEEIIMEVATNATPEIVSKFLDMSNLTEESRQQLEQDVNRALKIIPKLNNNQMNELLEMFNEKAETDKINEEEQVRIQSLCKNFIDSVRTKGTITLSNYNELVSNVNSTETYNIDLEIKVLDDNPGTKTESIGENSFYSVYTSQILQELNSTGTKKMKIGDIVELRITTVDNGTLVAQQSGMVIGN